MWIGSGLDAWGKAPGGGPRNDVGPGPSTKAVGSPAMGDDAGDFAHNRLSGHIPLWLSYALNIEVIELSDNYFTGEVPNFGSLKHLRILSFYENEHLGSGKSRDLKFLAPLTNCTDLLYLDFGGCNFGGDLPPYIANISNLNTFNIEDNYISGKIPTEIGQLINLERLVLMNNQLNGTIPNTIGKLPKLFLLILERNKLLGKIPSSLGNVTMLSVLTISSNNLQGVIPSSLANCKFLLHIDLYANNLNGFIPKGLFSSNGGLRPGKVPLEGVFGNKNGVFLDGNSKLCGGIQELHLPKCTTPPVDIDNTCYARLAIQQVM
nr:probable LRR receptor-like serine/threonine-protein kinase At3g47570 [Ipomoea batatas]